MDFESRLRTFNKNWSLTFITPFEMAQAGFVYLGVEDKVKCQNCNLRISSWKRKHIPLRIHFIIAHNKCEFVQGSMMTIKGRIHTFHDWPISFLRPRDMAKAGFLYSGFNDAVICFSCLTTFDRWKKKDTPMGQHMLNTPTCPFVISYKRQFNNPSGPVGLPSLSVKTIEDKLHTEGIVLFFNLLFYETMVTFDARLNSFNRCMISLQLDINAVCEAGFFYSGNGYCDSLTCFYCGCTLLQSSMNFEPWVTHANISKNSCNYLLLKKGKSFCDTVNAVRSEKIKSNQLAF